MKNFVKRLGIFAIAAIITVFVEFGLYFMSSSHSFLVILYYVLKLAIFLASLVVFVVITKINSAEWFDAKSEEEIVEWDKRLTLVFMAVVLSQCVVFLGFYLLGVYHPSIIQDYMFGVYHVVFFLFSVMPAILLMLTILILHKRKYHIKTGKLIFLCVASLIISLPLNGLIPW